MLLAWPVRGRAELAFHSLPCAEQGNERFGGASATPGVKPGPLGSNRRWGVGDGRAGQIRNKTNSPLFASLVRSSLLFYYSSYFRSGFIKWMLQLAAAPPRPLCCRTAASHAGQVPAPARWRGAIRRASFDSLSQLPLFNQIIGKVNLLDSCSLQPPPFPRSPQPHALPTRGSARPLHPDAVLRCHTKAKRREFSFFSEGRRAAASVCQAFPFPLSLFYFYFFFFFFFSLFYKFQSQSVALVPTSCFQLPVAPQGPSARCPTADWRRGAGAAPGALNLPSFEGSCSEKQEPGLPGENEAIYLSAVTGAFQSFFF